MVPTKNFSQITKAASLKGGIMQVPSTVKVGAITYEVRRVNHPLVVNRKECLGDIHYNESLIQVRTDCQGEQNAVQTVLHEMIHAMSRERGLNWGDNDELYTEELSKALHQVIVDNPVLFLHPNAEKQEVNA
jgi:hypothetical protein